MTGLSQQRTVSRLLCMALMGTNDFNFLAHTSDARKVSFCHIYSSLLDFFKVCRNIVLVTMLCELLSQGLMITYMSFLLQPFTELLRTFTVSSANDKVLWLSSSRPSQRASVLMKEVSVSHASNFVS